MLPTMIDKIYSVEDRQKHGFGLATQFADKIFQTNAAENQGKLQQPRLKLQRPRPV